MEVEFFILSWFFQEEDGDDLSQAAVKKLIPEKVKKRRKIQTEDGVSNHSNRPLIFYHSKHQQLSSRHTCLQSIYVGMSDKNIGLYVQVTVGRTFNIEVVFIYR